MREPQVRTRGLTSPTSTRGRRRAGALLVGRLVAVLAAALASGACYRYVPVPLGAVATEDVRIEITPSAAKRLASDLGVFSTAIDGRLASNGADSVSVHVPIDRQYRGMQVGSTEELIVLGRSEVVGVRKREFSRQRTVLVAVGSIVGFGALAAGIVQLADQNGSGEQTTTPPPPSGLRRLPTHSGVRLGVRVPLR
jgi:hypothetical protein